MIKVEVENNNIEKALFKFKKKIQASRVLEIYMRKQFYLKPSLEKRERRNNGKY